MKLSIIGFGPRGLSSLENIIHQAVKSNKLSSLDISIFNGSNDWGTGLAWRLKQPESYWINISDESLKNLPGRKPISTNEIDLPSFPSYSDWCEVKGFTIGDKSKHLYPSRVQMGRYLNERALSIIKVLVEIGILKIIDKCIRQLIWKNNHFTIIDEEKIKYDSGSCLLTVGHQSTNYSNEDKENINFSEKHNFTYIHNTYKSDLSSFNFYKRKIAIIGFGLTMLDIMRVATLEQGGVFKKINSENLKYIPNSKEPLKIIPYSFNGLPCVPKPYGDDVDSQFKPTRELTKRFREEVSQSIENLGSDFEPKHLLLPFSKVAETIHASIHQSSTKENINNLIYRWLKDGFSKNAEFLDDQSPIRDYLIETVRMSLGNRKPTLDYTIGQVWRHLQPIMYRLFAFAKIDSKVMKEIIEIDERTKRYSYGPPVESMQQLIALIDADIVETSFLNDPSVERTENGWKFDKNGKSVYANVLINSVLDNPDVSKIDTPLFESLKSQNLIESFDDELGISTTPDAKVVVSNKDIPLYVIGRNAKSSILGADAILECFSPDIEVWAKEFVKNI